MKKLGIALIILAIISLFFFFILPFGQKESSSTGVIKLGEIVEGLDNLTNNEADRNTFYGGGAEGYTDYKFLKSNQVHSKEG